jgi:hypothetical protein
MADPGSEMEKIGTVIARSLAYLCLKNSDVNQKATLLQKAQFLSGLGLPFADAAGMLGTTAASLTELARRAKNKGKNSGKESKGRGKRKK